MKYNLLLLFCICNFSIGYSQCEPAEDVPLDKVALYPLPFGVIPVEDGGTGITDTAFIGQLFDMTFTVVFPDTFLDPVTNLMTVGDTLQIIPDSTRFVFNDEDLEGFPDGLMMEVSPDTAMIGSSEGPTGCVRLFGTPTENVVPGDYFVFFGARSCIINPGLTGCVNVEIPSIFTGILGEYRLTIADNTSSIPEVLNDRQRLNISPNPFSDRTQIQFTTAGMTGEYQLQVMDLSGRRVFEQVIPIDEPQKVIDINPQDWESGIYVFQIIGREGQLTGKLVFR